MRAIAVVNPISGRRDVSAAVRAVAAELAAGGCELEVVETAGADDPRRIAAEAPADTRAVLAVGGDGTVRAVASGLAGRDIPLAVLPAGTENIIAKHFGMPRDPAKVARMILRGEVIRHDVGLINGVPFLIVCGAGFDAEVVERLAGSRKGHIGYISYVVPVWRTFWRHRFPTLRVETDGELLFEGRGFALVGLQPRYSLGLRALARAIHDDGYLDVSVFPCARRTTLMWHAVRMSLGRHLDRGGVLYRKCRAASISSPDQVPVECDGDPAGVLPIRCGIEPSALQLLTPA